MRLSKHLEVHKLRLNHFGSAAHVRHCFLEASQPARAATSRKTAASTKKPGHALPSKSSSASSQAIPCMIRISARKAKTPAAMPTAEPRRIFATFSETSAFASSISSRTSVEAF